MLALSTLVSLLATTATATAQLHNEQTYDFIVVGSGPGGAPVAAQLARDGFLVLLMDAGDDQRANTNTSVTVVLADVAAEDESLRWDFFIRYHEDDDIAHSNQYFTWQTPNGDHYVGQDPPEGSERLGIYYPRSGTLGGCSAHNAGAAMIPQDSYWDYIANITGDVSWRADNMRQYFEAFENNTYLSSGAPGHGFDGWLTLSETPIEDDGNPRFDILRQAAVELGYNEDELLSRSRVDANSLDPLRDSQQGLFNFPFHNTPLGNRTNANILLESTINARHTNGSRMYSLDIQLESLVTKVLFEQSEDQPRANGVEFMRGRSLYSADPRSSGAAQDVETEQIFARHGVIVSGGVFNTPQILKLSGIGPEDELQRFEIPLIVDLPGVGARLQDDYEISLAAYASVNLTAPNALETPECTLGVGDDPCVELWQQGEGPYTHAGATHSIHVRSSVADNDERDLVFWNPPGVFRGFFPGYSRPQGDPPSTFNFAMVHSQSRNHNGGAVSLRSNDPRDVPDIFFNLWAEGADEDLQALFEGIEFGRRVLGNVAEPVGPFTEFQPCVGLVGTNCTEAATKDFIRRQVYSHHASSTASIGADDDEMAVLDSRFRVRGTTGLYVVDGSALPRPPSPFPIIGQYMASYKAAQSIIEDARVA